MTKGGQLKSNDENKSVLARSELDEPKPNRDSKPAGRKPTRTGSGISKQTGKGKNVSSSRALTKPERHKTLNVINRTRPGTPHPGVRRNRPEKAKPPNDSRSIKIQKKIDQQSAFLKKVTGNQRDCLPEDDVKVKSQTRPSPKRIDKKMNRQSSFMRKKVSIFSSGSFSYSNEEDAPLLNVSASHITERPKLSKSRIKSAKIMFERRRVNSALSRAKRSNEYASLSKKHKFEVGAQVELQVIRSGSLKNQWIKAEIQAQTAATTYTVRVGPLSTTAGLSTGNLDEIEVYNTTYSSVPESHVRRPGERDPFTPPTSPGALVGPLQDLYMRDLKDNLYMMHTQSMPSMHADVPSMHADEKNNSPKESHYEAYETWRVEEEQKSGETTPKTPRSDLTTPPKGRRSRSYGHDDDFKLLYLMEAKEDKPIDEESEMDISSGPEWNLEFQRALESDSHDDLYRVAVDFLETAKIYGRVIIIEQHLPDTEKTIKPFEAGGLAGGAKYRVRNMLVKLVQDPVVSIRDGIPHYLYGGKFPNYEYAAKSAGHDLHGASHLLRVGLGQMQDEGEGVRVPMQVVIDYHGYRAVCMPWINLHSIVNGYKNGKLHHYKEYTDRGVGRRAHEIIRGAARALHLAKHQTIWQKTQYMAADVEIYEGTDKRIYGLDLARLFPPEHPEMVPHLGSSGKDQAIFFRLQRPELLQKRKELKAAPLSSDALSNFAKSARDYEQQNEEVAKSTAFLVKGVIPEFATTFEKEKLPEAEDQISKTRIHISLASRFHKAGVNNRHMGLVRSLIGSEKHRSALLVEMVARTLKNLLRGLLRAMVERTGRYSEIMAVVVRFLNLTVGSSDRRLPKGFKREKKHSIRRLPRPSFGSSTSTGNKDQMEYLKKLIKETVAEGEFWEYFVYKGILSRFGKFALKKNPHRLEQKISRLKLYAKKRKSQRRKLFSKERRNKAKESTSRRRRDDHDFTSKFELYDLALPDLYRIVTYMLEMVGFRLTPQCLARFAKGLHTKKASKTFTKFHIVDLMPTNLRVKKLSVLDLAQGRLLMDSAFNQLSFVQVSHSLVQKAISSFEQIVRSDPSDRETNAELNAAVELAELLKTTKATQTFHSIRHETVGWAGVIEQVIGRNAKKRVIVVTTRGIFVYKPSNLKIEQWRIGFADIGLIQLLRERQEFKLCVPSSYDRTFRSDLAHRICKKISSLIAKHNHCNLRYLHVLDDVYAFRTSSTVRSCIKGLRRSNAKAVAATTGIKRSWGTLLVEGGQVRRECAFFCQLRGSIFSGMPIEKVGDQPTSSALNTPNMSRASTIERTSTIERIHSNQSSTPADSSRKIYSSGRVDPEGKNAPFSPDEKTETIFSGWLELQTASQAGTLKYKMMWARMKKSPQGMRIVFTNSSKSSDIVHVVIINAKDSDSNFVRHSPRDSRCFFIHHGESTDTLFRARSPPEAAEWVRQLESRLDEFAKATLIERNAASSFPTAKTKYSYKQFQRTEKKTGFASWLFGKTADIILEPMDLLGCSVRDSFDPDRPKLIELSWWGSPKATYRITCEDYNDLRHWSANFKLAAGAANITGVKNGIRWTAFDPEIMAIEREVNV